MEIIETLYVEFSTCRQIAKINKISVKFLMMKTLSVCYQKYFEISFSRTFDTFMIFFTCHVIVLGKFELNLSSKWVWWFFNFHASGKDLQNSLSWKLWIFPIKHILKFDSAILLKFSRFSIFSTVMFWESRVTDTMVARSSSVQVIACSNPSQVPPLLMHVGKWLTAIPAIKRSAGVAPEVDLRKCTLHLHLKNKQIRQNPLWLWNPEETSPEIQNSGTSGPKRGHKCPPKTLNKKKFGENLNWFKDV